MLRAAPDVLASEFEQDVLSASLQLVRGFFCSSLGLRMPSLPVLLVQLEGLCLHSFAAAASRTKSHMQLGLFTALKRDFDVHCSS